MQFSTGNPSLTGYTTLLAGQDSVSAGEIFSSQEVQDAVNQAYAELWDRAMESDYSWGIKEAFITSVAAQVLYSLPSDFGGDVIDVAIELTGKDLSSDSSATWTYLSSTNHEHGVKLYRLGQISTPEKFYLEIVDGSDKFGIVAPPTVGGPNSISMIYQADYAELSASTDVPLIPSAYHQLICYMAAITLRTQKDMDSRNLQLTAQRLYPAFLEKVTAVAPEHNESFQTAGVVPTQTYAIQTGMYRRQ